MEWKKPSVLEGAQGSSGGLTALTCTIPLMPAGKEEPDWKLREHVSLRNAAAPACLSFVGMPIPAPASQCTSSHFHLSLGSPVLASSPYKSGFGEVYNSSCCCSLAPAMDSLLPSPFSTASYAAFFPAHLAVHQCTGPSSPCASSAAPSILPSIPRLRQRRSEAKAALLENGVKFSFLASLASTLPAFTSAEKAFGNGSKDDRKSREGMTQEGMKGTPLVRNSAEGNARLTKGVANFFQQFQRPTFGRAAKRKDSDSAQDSEHDVKAKKIRDGRKKAIQTTQHLMAGAVAAMVSRTIVAPLERLKLEYLVRGAKGSVIGTLQRILLNEGVRGFWKGNGVNVLRTAPFKSVNFFAYDAYRRQLLRWGERAEVTNWERLAAGAAAGITATILCFPLDTIRTIMVAPGGEALGGMIGCFQNLLRTEGFTALYKGLVPAVVSMAPGGAVFYGVYDMLKSSYLNSPEGRERSKARRKRNEEHPDEIAIQTDLDPFRTLLYGAIAGACSETVTYPLEVVRRAQQMQHAADKLGMAATIQSLLRKGGVKALYAGLLPSTMQVLPSAALSYFVYETVKTAFKIP